MSSSSSLLRKEPHFYPILLLASTVQSALVSGETSFGCSKRRHFQSAQCPCLRPGEEHPRPQTPDPRPRPRPQTPDPRPQTRQLPFRSCEWQIAPPCVCALGDKKCPKVPAIGRNLKQKQRFICTPLGICKQCPNLKCHPAVLQDLPYLLDIPGGLRTNMAVVMDSYVWPRASRYSHFHAKASAIWPNSHWKQARIFDRKSFDVACVQCGHSHSR